MTDAERVHHLELWQRAFGQPKPSSPRQLYRTTAVLAHEGGVMSEPTCGLCDGIFAEDLPDPRAFESARKYQRARKASEARRAQQLTAIHCPGCGLVVCEVCWSKHVGSEDRCTAERIVAIRAEHDRNVQELHTFDNRVFGRPPCRCCACAR